MGSGAVAQQVDNFLGSAIVQTLLDDPVAGSSALLTKAYIHLVSSFLFGLTSLVVTIVTYEELANQTNLSFVPVCGCVGAGGSLTMVGITALRLVAARRM